MLRDRGERNIVAGTVAHTATAVTRFGQTDLFEWRSSGDTSGRQQPTLCTGAFHENGGSGGCATLGQSTTGVSWGASSNGPGGPMVQQVTVNDTPATAAWMVVETSSGARVVGNTVGGVGYVEWDGAAGEPARVVLLDAGHNEIWEDDNLAFP